MVGFTASANREGGVVTFRLEGELDVSSVPSLSELAGHVELQGADRVVADLDKLSFMDSSGLGGLIRLQHLAAQSGVSLTVHNASARVQRLMHVTGLHELFELSWSE